MRKDFTKKTTSKTAGYSGTPLVKKLGIKENFTLIFVNAPENYFKIIGKLPENSTILSKPAEKTDFIHFFTKDKNELAEKFPKLKKILKPAGALWISWPKKTSKIETNLNENIIRETGLKNGLVDVKVCAIDESWSGLKFVFRLKDR